MSRLRTCSAPYAARRIQYQPVAVATVWTTPSAMPPSTYWIEIAVSASQSSENQARMSQPSADVIAPVVTTTSAMVARRRTRPCGGRSDRTAASVMVPASVTRGAATSSGVDDSPVLGAEDAFRHDRRGHGARARHARGDALADHGLVLRTRPRALRSSAAVRRLLLSRRAHDDAVHRDRRRPRARRRRRLEVRRYEDVGRRRRRRARRLHGLVCRETDAAPA